MNKAMWALISTAGLVVATLSVSTQVVASAHEKQAVSPILTPPPPVVPYTQNFESDKKYRQRMENVDQLATYYHIEWSEPYLFIGHPRRQTLQPQHGHQTDVMVQRMLTPEYFTEVYRVHARNTPDTRFVYINKRHARAKTFDLSADEVKRVADLHSADHHIVFANLHATVKSQQPLLFRFARRLINERICHSVQYGTVEPHNLVTMSCGDGMSYSLTLEQIERGVAIDRRIVTYEALE